MLKAAISDLPSRPLGVVILKSFRREGISQLSEVMQGEAHDIHLSDLNIKWAEVDILAFSLEREGTMVVREGEECQVGIKG